MGEETNTSISIAIQEIVRIGGTVTEIYEWALFTDCFQHPAFRRSLKKNISFRKTSSGKRKGEKVVEQVLKLKMNALFGQTLRNDLDYKHEFKIETWMETENVEGIEEYDNLQNGGYFVQV